MKNQRVREIKTVLFNKEGVLEEMGSLVRLYKYSPTQTAGKICYFTCGNGFELPIRDVLNERHTGFKKEPNYETATYNYFTNCNQLSLASAVKRGTSHILFLTKYQGLIKEYSGKYFITGMYKIGWVGKAFGRKFVKASVMAFTKIEDAYEITPKRWKKIYPGTGRPELTNLRYAIQTVRGDIFEEIINNLVEKNVIESYVQLITNLYKKSN